MMNRIIKHDLSCTVPNCTDYGSYNAIPSWDKIPIKEKLRGSAKLGFYVKKWINVQPVFVRISMPSNNNITTTTS